MRKNLFPLGVYLFICWVLARIWFFCHLPCPTSLTCAVSMSLLQTEDNWNKRKCCDTPQAWFLVSNKTRGKVIRNNMLLIEMWIWGMFFEKQRKTPGMPRNIYLFELANPQIKIAKLGIYPTVFLFAGESHQKTIAFFWRDFTPWALQHNILVTFATFCGRG